MLAGAGRPKQCASAAVVVALSGSQLRQVVDSFGLIEWGENRGDADDGKSGKC